MTDLVAGVCITAIASVTGAAIAAYATIKAKRITAFEQKVKVLDNNAEYRECIMIEINKLQAITRASRVCLFEYSNGSHTHSGVCLQYVECTYEATDDTTKGIAQSFISSKMPIGKFISVINRIKNSPTGWDRCSNTDYDEVIAKIQRDWRTVTSYSFRLTDVVWDGVVTLSWVHNDVHLSAGTLEEIRVRVGHIAHLQTLLKTKK